MTTRLLLLLPLLLLHVAMGTATFMPLRRFRPAPILDPQPVGDKLGGLGELSEESEILRGDENVGAEDFESYTNSFEVTRPLAPPPGSSKCVVDIMTNHLFANNPPPFVANYTPPTACGKRWSLVTLSFSAYVKGRQFDRIVDIFFGDLQVLRTTTEEPSQTGVRWRLDADITRFQPYLAQPRVVHVSMGNVVEGIYTGVYNMSMSLVFYSGPPPPRCADVIIPIGPSDGRYAPFGISDVNPSGDTVLSGLPRNILRAEVEVLASATAADEFYWANTPSEYADGLPPEYRGGVYGGGVFRHTTLAIDSIFAGSVLAYPVIYTGGVNPYFWRPVVGIGAFVVPTYRVDVTPFAGLLADGRNHSLRVGVDGVIAGGWWWVNAALHLWLDPNVEATWGGLLETEDPSFEVEERVRWYPNGVDANLSTRAAHASKIRGYVVSSYGNATCTVERTYALHNFNQVLEEMAADKTAQTISSHATSVFGVEGEAAIYSSREAFEFPLETDIRYTLLPGGGFSEESSYSHGFNFKRETEFRGKSVEIQLNTQAGSGVYSSILPGGGGSSQTFLSNVDGDCYSRSLKQANLTFEYDREGRSCVGVEFGPAFIAPLNQMWAEVEERMSSSWTQSVSRH